jgi:hypothetical protein
MDIPGMVVITLNVVVGNTKYMQFMLVVHVFGPNPATRWHFEGPVHSMWLRLRIVVVVTP